MPIVLLILLSGIQVLAESIVQIRGSPTNVLGRQIQASHGKLIEVRQQQPIFPQINDDTVKDFATPQELAERRARSLFLKALPNVSPTYARSISEIFGKGGEPLLTPKLLEATVVHAQEAVVGTWARVQDHIVLNIQEPIIQLSKHSRQLHIETPQQGQWLRPTSVSQVSTLIPWELCFSWISWICFRLLCLSVGVYLYVSGIVVPLIIHEIRTAFDLVKASVNCLYLCSHVCFAVFRKSASFFVYCSSCAISCGRLGLRAGTVVLNSISVAVSSAVINVATAAAGTAASIGNTFASAGIVAKTVTASVAGGVVSSLAAVIVTCNPRSPRTDVVNSTPVQAAAPIVVTTAAQSDNITDVIMHAHSPAVEEHITQLEDSALAAMRTGQVQEAVRALQQGEEYLCRMGKEMHVDVASLRHLLAKCRLAIGEPQLAEKLLRRVLTVYAYACGGCTSTDMYTAQALEDMKMALEAQGRHVEAHAAGARASEIRMLLQSNGAPVVTTPGGCAESKIVDSRVDVATADAISDKPPVPVLAPVISAASMSMLDIDELERRLLTGGSQPLHLPLPVRTDAHAKGAVFDIEPILKSDSAKYHASAVSSSMAGMQKVRQPTSPLRENVARQAHVQIEVSKSSVKLTSHQKIQSFSARNGTPPTSPMRARVTTAAPLAQRHPTAYIR